jgi:Na+-translocating ferredoxin:NAD+ oxidoreductase subunit G
MNGVVVRSAVSLAIVAGLCGAMVSGVDVFTRDRIRANEDREKLQLVDAILPPETYDNRLMRDTIKLSPSKLLGIPETTLAYRARRGGKPVAVLFEAMSPNGYGGKIRIFVAVGQDGTVSGVRVLAHNETPGWGDYIEAQKSKWIHIFEGASLDRQHPPDWAVRKDGGSFQFVSRATVSARAVVDAVHRAALYYETFKDRIFETDKRVVP